MIRPLATNLPGRILRLAVDAGEDGINVDQAVAHVLVRPPFPVLTGPFADRATRYTDWRRRVLADEATAKTKVSRAFGRLQEGGFLVTRGAPRVSSWFTDRIRTHGLDKALEVAASRAALEDGKHAADSHDHMQRRVLLITMTTRNPKTTRDAVGASASGARLRAWSWLCSVGIIVPPSQRVATEAGVALVSTWSTP